MKCHKCPNWKFNLRFPVGLGPICKIFGMPIQQARRHCIAQGRELDNSKKKSVETEAWPGARRGYGPITKKI